MYKSFYSLSRVPFSRDVPVDAVCMYPRFEEAAGRLLYTAKNRGFAVVAGPCGTGKTTLLRTVFSKLQHDRYRVIYISDSALSPSGFYRNAIYQLGAQPRRSLTDAKRQFADLVKNMPGNTGMHPVFVLDESHLFQAGMLEEIRFVLNTDFDSQSLAGIILSGQDELVDKLRLVQMTAIRQRIDQLCMLKALSKSETHKYIGHHLQTAGTLSPIFTDSAQDAIHEFSGGIPRIVDKLCTNLLMYGCQERKPVLDEHDTALIAENEFII